MKTKSKVRFFWKKGAKKRVPANVAGARLEEIRDRNSGLLTVESIVDDARSSESPLHPAFDWNDEDAAEKWRIEQAKGIVRNLVVLVHKENGAKEAVRYYVSIENESGDDESQRAYISLEDAKKDTGTMEQVIQDAWNGLQSWKHRYGQLREFSSVVLAIEMTERKMKSKSPVGPGRAVEARA